MSNDFTKQLKVDSMDKDEIRRQALVKAVEDALIEKKNGRKATISEIMESSSWGTLNLHSFLDSERKDLIERIGKDLANGQISDEHFNYFKSYRNLIRFVDRYLEKLHETIEAETSGEIIITPEIDSEMAIIMQELEADKENTIE